MRCSLDIVMSMSIWAHSIAQNFFVYPHTFSQKLDGYGSTGVAQHQLSMSMHTLNVRVWVCASKCSARMHAWVHAVYTSACVLVLVQSCQFSLGLIQSCQKVIETFVPLKILVSTYFREFSTIKCLFYKNMVQGHCMDGRQSLKICALKKQENQKPQSCEIKLRLNLNITKIVVFIFISRLVRGFIRSN